MLHKNFILALASVVSFASTACLSPVPELSIAEATLIDLTHTFDEQTVYWPTAPGFELHSEFEGDTEGGWFYESNTLSTSEHGGTHLDAPVHFAKNAHSTDQIPLERLVAPAAVIDVAAACQADRDHAITVSEIKAWEIVHGPLREDEIVLFRTGFDEYWPDAQNYLGTNQKGVAGVGLLRFPGLSAEAATWLAQTRRVAAVGIDTASLDPGQSKTFLAHRILFRQNIPGFENLTALGTLPARGATMIALPMKVGSGSGGPLRAIAILP